jgi:hypothetical protein
MSTFSHSITSEVNMIAVVGQFESVEINGGQNVSAFSTDGTMAGNSDSNVPTEKAVTTYVTTLAANFGLVSQTFYVATDGTDDAEDYRGKRPSSPFATIKYALAAITDSSSTKKYTVFVASGNYTEVNPLTVPDYVSIVGTGGPITTLITGSVDDDLLIGGDSSSIEGVSFRLYSDVSVGKNNACVVVSTAVTFKISNCFIDNVNNSGSSNGTGLRSSHANAHIHAINIFFRGYFEYGTDVQSGGIHVQNLITAHDAIGTTIVNVSAGHSVIFGIEVSCDTPDDIVNAIIVNGAGSCKLVGGRIENVTNAFTISGAGSSTTTIGVKSVGINGVTRSLYTDTSSVIGNFSSHATNIDRDKIVLATSTTFNTYIEGFDTSSKKFRFISDLAIGKDGDGNSLAVGEGGPYAYNTLCYTNTGATWVDVTENASISFPGLAADDAIYFGDTDSYNFYGIHHYLTTAIDLGTGSIAWEYYNGSIWVEFNVMETVSTTSVSNKSATFSGSTSETYVIRFDTHISALITATTVDSTLGVWIRCRIVTAITTSPVFTGGVITVANRFKLCGSYSEFRSNGTRSYHGLSRSEKRSYGIFQKSSAANQDLTISSNITFLMEDNEFTPGVIDSSGIIFPITGNIDTSSGLEITLTGYGSSDVSVGNIRTIYFIVYMASVPVGGKFDGTNTETNNIASLTFDDETAYALETRIDLTTANFNISNLSVGDTLFIQASRQGGTANDTYEGNVVLAGLNVHYHEWQDGSFD